MPNTSEIWVWIIMVLLAQAYLINEFWITPAGVPAF